MSTLNKATAPVKPTRAEIIKHAAGQASCLAAMLASVEFIHPGLQNDMLLTCMNFAEDLEKALNETLRLEAA